MPTRKPSKADKPRPFVYDGPPDLRFKNDPRFVLPQFKDALRLPPRSPDSKRVQEWRRRFDAAERRRLFGDDEVPSTAAAPAPVRRKSRVKKSRLLSPSQIEEAQKYFNDQIDKNPDHWSTEEEAARDITVNFLKLAEGSWQTVRTWVIRPVLKRRLRQKNKK